MTVTLTPYFTDPNGGSDTQNVSHTRSDGTNEWREVHTAVFNLADDFEKHTKAAVLKRDSAGKIDPSAEEQKKALLGSLKTLMEPYLAAQPDDRKTAFADAVRIQLFERDKRNAAGQLITADGAPGGKIGDDQQLQAELFKGLAALTIDEAKKAKVFLKPTASSVLDGIAAMAEEAAAYECAAGITGDERKAFRKKSADNMQAYISQQFSQMPDKESVWDFYAEMAEEVEKKKRAANDTAEKKIYGKLLTGLEETKDSLYKQGYETLTWEEAKRNTMAAVAVEAGRYLGTPMELLTRPFMNAADGIHENRHHLLTVAAGLGAGALLLGGSALATGGTSLLVGGGLIALSWLAKKGEEEVKKGLQHLNDNMTGVRLGDDGKPLRDATDLQQNRSLSIVDVVRSSLGYDIELKDGKAPKHGYNR